VRVFLAINPPPELRRAAWDATAPLRELAPDIGWVAEPKIHLTLKFIGTMEQDALPALADAMVAIARTHAAPMVHVSSVGAFPTFRRPRVIWMGIEPEPRLELLHHDIEVACDTLGHELEGRPYRPHLTLGRVRKPAPLEDLKKLRAAATRIRFSDEFLGRSIDVMESIPGPGGSTYRLVASAPMRGA
jgi:2'-5' RNA ligase